MTLPEPIRRDAELYRCSRCSRVFRSLREYSDHCADADTARVERNSALIGLLVREDSFYPAYAVIEGVDPCTGNLKGRCVRFGDRDGELTIGSSAFTGGLWSKVEAVTDAPAARSRFVEGAVMEACRMLRFDEWRPMVEREDEEPVPEPDLPPIVEHSECWVCPDCHAVFQSEGMCRLHIRYECRHIAEASGLIGLPVRVNDRVYGMVTGYNADDNTYEVWGVYAGASDSGCTLRPIKGPARRDSLHTMGEDEIVNKVSSFVREHAGRVFDRMLGEGSE